MGKTTREAPAPVRRPHRRRAGRDPAHRRLAPQTRPGHRDSRAGCGSGTFRPGPGGRALRRRSAPFRGFVSYLGRCAALGRRQRAYHRGQLQDRRGSPGRRGGHHPPRHGGALSHPAGGGGQRGESVRAVGVADRPTGEGHRQGRGAGELGVLQRPQRARRNGPAHGPERRPTHEIERQGRWKQGGGMVGRYTRGETAGSVLRYL